MLGIRRMDRFPYACISELCGMMKGVDKRIDEGVLQLRGLLIESMYENVLIVAQWVNGRDDLIL